MKTVTTEVNGIKIRYLELKNEGKETIVFLHYGGSTLAVWNGVIPYFKDKYHIIALDLRCHGFSEMSVEECHMDDMAADVVGLMEELEVKKAYIVGSSLGADVAISLAANYPKKVIALALDGALFDLDGPDSKKQLIKPEDIEKAKNDLKERVLSRKEQFFDSREAFINHYKAQWEKHFPWSDVVQTAYEDAIKETKDGKFTTCQTGEVIWRYIDPLYGIRFSSYFEKINCPVLWLPDEKESDHEVVKRNLKKYAKNLSYHKIVTIKGSVHAYTCLLQPEAFAKEIQVFLETIKKH